MRAPFIMATSAALTVFSTGCAVERSDQVESELRKNALQASDGVQKIQRALHDPELTSSELGEGMLRVESATRILRAIETDDRGSDLQQLMAIVHQARAWDDVARTLESADAPNLEAAQRATMSAVLAEKALPARAQAEESYRRARDRACRSSLDHLPVMLEILDGMTRYGARDIGNISLDRACSEQ